MQEQKKRQLKGDSVEMTSVEFKKKNKFKTAADGGPGTELPHYTDQV